MTFPYKDALLSFAVLLITFSYYFQTNRMPEWTSFVGCVMYEVGLCLLYSFPTKIYDFEIWDSKSNLGHQV